MGLIRHTQHHSQYQPFTLPNALLPTHMLPADKFRASAMRKVAAALDAYPNKVRV